MVLYIWSRKDPYRQVTLWGFAFAAWQYPFALLVLGILFGSNPILDILGIVIGHLYHFLVDVVPVKYGKQVIRCPQFIYDLYEHGNLHGRATGWQRGPGHRLDR
jgi:Derlin-2/3